MARARKIKVKDEFAIKNFAEKVLTAKEWLLVHTRSTDGNRHAKVFSVNRSGDVLHESYYAAISLDYAYSDDGILFSGHGFSCATDLTHAIAWFAVNQGIVARHEHQALVEKLRVREY